MDAVTADLRERLREFCETDPRTMWRFLVRTALLLALAWTVVLAPLPVLVRLPASLVVAAPP
jgi:hypothetical protein